MKGIVFKEGQSPIKATYEQVFKASPPGSSKEDLLEVAEQFTTRPDTTSFDYGGGFDTNISVDSYSSEEEEPESSIEPMEKLPPKELPVETKGPDLKKRKYKKKEKKAGVEVDLDYYRKSAKIDFSKTKKKKKKKSTKLKNWIKNLFKNKKTKI